MREVAALSVSPGVSELNETVGTAFFGRIRELIDEAGPDRRVDVAISGGAIVTSLLPSLVRRVGEVPWSRVRMWLVDERFVPAADERRNDEAAWDGFLSRAPGVEFVRMPTSDRSSPGAGCLKGAADAFAATWATLMGERSFDIALIGMGPDGHVCSLFPGRYDAHERRRIIAVDDSPKPPAKRISVSMPVMTQCREVWLTTSGASKADALARAFGGASPHEVPVAALLSAKTRVYVDAAAASGFAHS